MFLTESPLVAFIAAGDGGADRVRNFGEYNSGKKSELLGK